MISVPPDVTPDDTAPTYIYAVGVSSFLQTFDYYNSVTIDGVTYNSETLGTVVLPEQYGQPLLAKDVFPVDVALAGVSGMGCRASGYTPDVNSYGDQYIFMIVCNEPHTITVNLTINSVTSDYPLYGGQFTYVNHCMDVTTADPTTEQVLFLNCPFVDSTGVSTIPMTYDVSGVMIDDPTGIEAEVNLRINTTNTLLYYNVGYVNNNDGTVTVTMQIPYIDVDPPNEVLPFDLRGIDSTSGSFNLTPC